MWESRSLAMCLNSLIGGLMRKENPSNKQIKKVGLSVSTVLVGKIDSVMKQVPV